MGRRSHKASLESRLRHYRCDPSLASWLMRIARTNSTLSHHLDDFVRLGGVTAVGLLEVWSAGRDLDALKLRMGKELPGIMQSLYTITCAMPGTLNGKCLEEYDDDVQIADLDDDNLGQVRAIPVSVEDDESSDSDDLMD